MSHADSVRQRTAKRATEIMQLLSEDDRQTMIDWSSFSSEVAVAQKDRRADFQIAAMVSSILGVMLTVCVLFVSWYMYPWPWAPPPAPPPGSCDNAIQTAVEQAVSQSHFKIDWTRLTNAGTTWSFSQPLGFECVRVERTGAFMCDHVPDPDTLLPSAPAAE